MLLDDKIIKKLELVRVIDIDTGELKRIEIDKTVRPRLHAIEQYYREWNKKDKGKELLLADLKGVKIA